ncbi:hypothetical protein AL073_06160 [Loktanella sp. 1ANDIMAR09]|nr:hypothetical protein AL073_06160 [Loktanella sp. 1ANDIMAR09]
MIVYEYHIENVTPIIFATAFIILLPGVLLRKSTDIVKHYSNGLNFATIIYFIAALFTLYIYEEEPAFAIAGLPIFAFHLAQFMIMGKRMSMTILILLILLSISMESRIVLLTQLILIAFAASISKRITFRMKALVFASFLSFLVIFLLNWRFMELIGGGDQALELGGVSVNTSGRIYYWQIIFESALENPLVGSGYSVPISLFDVRNWLHPHNDYLRLFHKLGLVGFAIWAWFMLAFIWSFQSLNKAGQRTGNHLRAWVLERTILFSVLSLLLVMTTDNPLAYPYIMLPVGYLIGAAPVLRESYSSNRTV